MTRDFMVATDISVPSTVSVTVLCAAAAKPPAKVSANKVTKMSARRCGERDSWSLLNAFKSVLIPTRTPVCFRVPPHRSQNGNQPLQQQQLASVHDVFTARP